MILRIERAPGSAEGLRPPWPHVLLLPECRLLGAPVADHEALAGDDIASGTLPRAPTSTSSAAGPRSCATPPGREPGRAARITARAPSATPGTVTLTAARLTIAREHGYPSSPQLVTKV